MAVQETSSTDDSDEKAREKNICGEEGSDGDHSLEASQSKTNAQHGKGKRSSSGEKAGSNTFVEKRAVMVTIPLRLPKAKQTPDMERERGVLLVKRLGSNTFVEKRAVMVTIPLRLPKTKQMDPKVEREKREVLLMKSLWRKTFVTKRAVMRMNSYPVISEKN